MLISDPGALREHRTRQGHSTRTLATAAGVSQPTIVRLEREPVNVTPDTAWRIARALGLTATDIARTSVGASS